MGEEMWECVIIPMCVHRQHFIMWNNVIDDPTPIANRYTWWWVNGWLTPWTWNDNCDFTCEAWYLYNPLKRSCDPAPIGSYSTWGNQSLTWTACNKPAKAYFAYTYPVWWWSYLTWESWTDPYFGWFTTSGTNVNGCDFVCAPWYFKYF